MRKARKIVDVYGAIKDMILTGQYKPGNKLPDQELAVELGVSRTPVRDALNRLAQDGLLEQSKGKGYRVADLSAQQVADLYALREVLEAHAVRLAVERITPSSIEELNQVLAALQKLSEDPSRRGEEIRVGLRIHEIIARATGDSFLHETVLRLLNRMHFFIWMDTLNEDPQAADLTRQEHRDLVAFIQAGNADAAEALVRTHIRTGKDGILKILMARDAFYQPGKVDHFPPGHTSHKTQSAWLGGTS
jgi:DNA-binding GntR family transcriptional regulator